MKAIVITKNNIKDVYGRLRKFFYNKNKTGFESWHNFNCGFKKHISRYITITIRDDEYSKEEKCKISIMYPAPEEIELCNYRKEYIICGEKRDSVPYIRMHITATDSTRFDVGDKIAFCGNRIIHKSKLFDDYVYQVYQATPMSEHEQNILKECAKRESQFYDSLYEDDY